MTASIRSVAIVGAGISGLCAARVLTKGGLNVTIFEKARGVGGRTSTRRENEYTFDHGAQFFTIADNRFHEIVQEWESAGIVTQWNSPVVVLNKGSSKPASDTRQRFVGVPGMNAMARHLAEETRVVLNTRITRCERRENLWHVFDEKEVLTGAFDAVIVTTPPKQATPLLAHSPLLLAAAGRVELSPCWALMAAFDRRLDIPFDGAYVENSSLAWIVRNGSKPLRPSHETWVIHASPKR
jgi:renalase